MTRFQFLILLIVFLSVPLQGTSQNSQLKAKLSGEEFIIENDRIVFSYQWNNGNLILKSLKLKSEALTLDFESNEMPDFKFTKTDIQPQNGSFSTNRIKSIYSESDYLEVRIDFDLEELTITRVIHVFQGIAGVSQFFEVSGNYPDALHPYSAAYDSKEMIESDLNLGQNYLDFRMGFLPISDLHNSISVIENIDATDHHNTLVKESEILPYVKPEFLKGNLLLSKSKSLDPFIFIMKESPGTNSQQAYPGFDYSVTAEGIGVHGLGFTPNHLRSKKPITSYGYFIGISSSSTLELLTELRKYQFAKRSYKPDRDGIIVANTWGDRSKDSRMNEAFILEEIKKSAKLGVDVVQLDDGWQQGLSRNSALKAGELWDSWEDSDWEFHKTRFPDGPKKIIREAKKWGIEIGLWFNPTKKNNYELWERDANILIGYYRNFGIRVFKIDGIEITSKAAEQNLKALFDKVMVFSGGEVVFNMDVTAGIRPGYHYFQEYGQIFLENRYTDWGNYFPHWTLRNLWMLSKYVPAQKLQIEFLNKWRNHHKYDPNDELTPFNIPFDYIFAITMMAQPLAWMEVSNLPEEGLEIDSIIKKYKQHRADIHSGLILPIGQEPDGFSWTGFQSMDPSNTDGYFLIFRENNEKQTGSLSTWLQPNNMIKLEPIIGNGAPGIHTVDKYGAIQVSLPEKFSFCLFKYQILDQD